MSKYSQLIAKTSREKVIKSLKTIFNTNKRNLNNSSVNLSVAINKNKKNNQKNMNSNNFESGSSSNKVLSNEIFKRNWKNTYIGDQSKTQSGLQFTLMSYNILAQSLLEIHPSLYKNHKEEYLKWDFRLNRIVEEINYIKPEILCLQEVEHAHLNEISLRLVNLNFKFIFKKRTGDKPDGCAIFYNTQLFELNESHTVEYFQPNVEILNRENVAIILILSLKSKPNVKFVVADTHLLYNPRRQDVRLAQTQVLLAELDRISHNGLNKNGDNVYLPIILTGDFNLQPESAPYALITKGILDYHQLSPKLLEHETKFNNPNSLLTPELEINDNCQHSNIRKTKEGKTKLYHSELSELNTKINEEELKIPEEKNTFNTGVLNHNLKLSSVNYYRSNWRHEANASTFQNKWLITDYIFYSKCYNYKYKKITEGSLKLLSRYELPTVKQCESIERIPNYYLGSDHFSLAAKFLLQTTQYK